MDTDKKSNVAKIAAAVLALVVTFAAGSFSTGNGHGEHLMKGVVGCAPCTSEVVGAVYNAQKEQTSNIVTAIQSLAREQENIVKFIQAKHPQAVAPVESE